MKDRIRISDVSSYYLQNVKRRLNLFGQANYVPMRIAFGRSIMSQREPKVTDITPEVLQKAKEVRGNEQPALSTFETDQRLYFQVLLSQKYKRKIEDDEYVDLLTTHIEHGLWLIYNETEKISGFDYLISIATAAQTKRIKVNENSGMDNVSENIEPADAELLNLRIGIEKKSQKPIIYSVNSANNPHFGIMGGSGSGKTYFLKHLLTQIRHQSN